MIEINLQPLSGRDLKLMAGRLYARKHRVDNYERVKELDRARAKANRPKKQENQQAFYRRRIDEGAALKMKPCMDCNGCFPPCAMDWDHREGETKVDGPGRLVTRRKGLHAAEIVKCDLVCSNCHRVRTAKRAGSPTALPWHSS